MKCSVKVEVRYQAFEVEPTPLSLAVLGTAESRHSKKFHKEKYTFNTKLLLNRR